jgi:putative Mg2+ transporter-C (MgtC) family protein
VYFQKLLKSYKNYYTKEVFKVRVIEIVIRLILAVVIGGLVGYEREYKNKTAGFRTHILVCVGAAVTSMIQMISIQDSIRLVQQNPILKDILSTDIGRMGAQVITGVGFLGAGAIIRDKGSVKGLTTAASLWVVACIGLAVGLGYYSLSLLSAFSLFLVLAALKKFEQKLFEQTTEVKLRVECIEVKDVIKNISLYFNNSKIKINNIEIEAESKQGFGEYNSIVYTLHLPKYITVQEIKENLLNIVNIINVIKEEVGD